MNVKYALLLWGFLQAAVNAPAATTAEVLVDLDRLVAEKRYLSAFELLNEQENGNSDPDIVLKKADLALKYFVNSLNHRVFSFKNLKEEENILEVRGAVGTSTIFPFDIEEVFTTLIKNNPEDQRLHVALADYYLDVYDRFRGRWEKSDEAESNFRKSLKEDHAVFKAIGEIRLRAGNPSERTK